MSDSAYFVSPPSGPGPGVLLLHDWWGLTPFFRRTADRLSDLGFTVLAPDLAVGRTFDDPLLAQRHLAELDPDRLAGLTLASAGIVRGRSVDPERRIAVIGFSMGASLGLWASVRRPEDIGAVVAFYGVQSIDFDGASARYQVHLAEDDDLVPEDDAVFMEATMGLAGVDVQVHRYPGTRHFFFEPDRGTHDPAAAELAWDRTVAFLAAAFDDDGGPSASGD